MKRIALLLVLLAGCREVVDLAPDAAPTPEPDAFAIPPDAAVIDGGNTVDATPLGPDAAAGIDAP